MAHYALINEKNIVITVITGVDEDIMQLDENNKLVGGSSEAWEQFYESLPWFQGLYCKRTSYNGNIRKNYAGIGFTFDKERNAFIPPKIFDSWLLDEESCNWIPPIAYPSDDNDYFWDEEIKNWKLVKNGEQI